MIVKVREKKAGDGVWYCFAADGEQRKAIRCGERKVADAQAKRWEALVTLGKLQEIFTGAPVAKKAVAVAGPVFPCLRDAVESWISQQEAIGDNGKGEGLRGSSPTIYRRACAKWIFPTLGDVTIDKLTRPQVGAAILAIKAAGRSISLIEQCRNPLRGTLQEQVELDKLPVNVAADLGAFVGKMKRNKRHEFFTEQEGKKIIETAKTFCPRWAAFVEVGLKAGLRVAEVTALYKSDVDFKAGKITVKRSWSSKAGKLQPCKNGKERVVDASPALLAALKAQIETVTLDGQAGEWRADEKLRLFPTERGAWLNENQGHAWWAGLLKAAKVRYLSFHHTRHSFATWHVQNGCDYQWLQHQLGHASVSQTMDTYAHHRKDDPRHAGNAAKLDALIGC